jgi:hypothetical protein
MYHGRKCPRPWHLRPIKSADYCTNDLQPGVLLQTASVHSRAVARDYACRPDTWASEWVDPDLHAPALRIIEVAKEQRMSHQAHLAMIHNTTGDPTDPAARIL